MKSADRKKITEMTEKELHIIASSDDVLDQELSWEELKILSRVWDEQNGAK